VTNKRALFDEAGDNGALRNVNALLTDFERKPNVTLEEGPRTVAACSADAIGAEKTRPVDRTPVGVATVRLTNALLCIAAILSMYTPRRDDARGGARWTLRSWQ
tara:strand:- start:686 stop:997 length:312 start_codon:yes stop_codon:yes gene_type:complete